MLDTVIVIIHFTRELNLANRDVYFQFWRLSSFAIVYTMTSEQMQSNCCENAKYDKQKPSVLTSVSIKALSTKEKCCKMIVLPFKLFMNVNKSYTNKN